MNRKIILIIHLACSATFICGFFGAYSFAREETVEAIGNSLENIESLKRDCEKDLPRNEECVLIYEFIPVKTKGE